MEFVCKIFNDWGLDYSVSFHVFVWDMEVNGYPYQVRLQLFLVPGISVWLVQLIVSTMLSVHRPSLSHRYPVLCICPTIPLMVSGGIMLLVWPSVLQVWFCSLCAVLRKILFHFSCLQLTPIPLKYFFVFFYHFHIFCSFLDHFDSHFVFIH